jgi:hypothetical protein
VENIISAIMPLDLGERPESQIRKRKQKTEAPDPHPQLSVKPPKKSRQSRNRTPPEFWESLSQVPLCRRALREFNRRTVRRTIPKPPVRSALKGDLVKQLKRFARHGGPDLRDIRGVSLIYAMENHANSFLRFSKTAQAVCSAWWSGPW